MTTPADNAADLKRLLEGRPEDIQRSIEKLRDLIRSVAPTLVEVVSLGHPNLVAYGLTGKMRDFLLVIVPHTNHTNLQFANGSTLPDPERLLEGTGKNIRHVKIRAPEEADRSALVSLVIEQLATRGLRAG